MNKYRWFMWGGVGVVVLVIALLIAINAAIHTLRSTGHAVARTPSQVAFIDLTGGDTEQAYGDVYLVDADSGELARLTTGGQVTAIEWMPDGEDLYLNTRGADTSTYFYSLHVGAGVLSPLTGDRSARTVGLFGEASPDGKLIVYGTDTIRWQNQGQIVVAARDRSSPHTIGSGGEPQWSPDGKRIVYAWNHGDETGSDIYTMAADGSDVHKVGGLPGDDVMPTWSPDGLTIVFSSLTRDATGGTSGWNLYRIDVDGGNLTRLMETMEPHQHQFLPDGKAVYTADLFEMCLVPVDGSQPSCLHTFDADLSPDGKRVIITTPGDSLPGSMLRSERLCVELIDGVSLADGPCFYDSPGGVFYPAWRPG